MNYRDLIKNSLPDTIREESKVRWLGKKRRFADFIVWMEDHQIIERISRVGTKQTKLFLSKIDFNDDWGKDIEGSMRKTIIDRRDKNDNLKEDNRNLELRTILADFSKK